MNDGALWSWYLKTLLTFGESFYVIKWDIKSCRSHHEQKYLEVSVICMRTRSLSNLSKCYVNTTKNVRYENKVTQNVLWIFNALQLKCNASINITE